MVNTLAWASPVSLFLRAGQSDPQAAHTTHAEDTPPPLSRSRITELTGAALVPRYRNNAYSRSWPLPTAGPWACPEPHNPSQMRLRGLHFW